jgi:AcrR family transcriptional regulator
MTAFTDVTAMPRPDRSPERRRELAPLLARAFADLGYRRATTAELAQRCAVQEKALFRLWPDKRAMFLAALDQVFSESEALWARLATEPGRRQSTAERLLAHEAEHHGEHRLYRIVFAGLSEADDPVIAKALGTLYRRFQRLIQGEIEGHRRGKKRARDPDPALAAWAIVGLGTVANIGREFGLLKPRERAQLFERIGAQLLGGG